MGLTSMTYYFIMVYKSVKVLFMYSTIHLPSGTSLKSPPMNTGRSVYLSFKWSETSLDYKHLIQTGSKATDLAFRWVSAKTNLKVGSYLDQKRQYIRN